jgi:hypothetical protein
MAVLELHPRYQVLALLMLEVVVAGVIAMQMACLLAVLVAVVLVVVQV